MSQSTVARDENEACWLFRLPPLALEHVLALAGFHLIMEASMRLWGLYRSCHAGRLAISHLIKSASVTVVDGGTHGDACDFPRLATNMRKLTVRIVNPAALPNFLADARVRGILSTVPELEFVAPPYHATDSPLSCDRFDLAAIAAVLPPSLRCLTLRPQEALAVAPLAALTGLRSLTICNDVGDQLDGAALVRLASTALTSLSRLELKLPSHAALSPFPGLTALRGLAHLGLDTTECNDAGRERQQLSLLSSLSRLTCLQLRDRFVERDGAWQTPILQYLQPVVCCRQLLRLELPRLHLSSPHALHLLQTSMPQLTYLHFNALKLPPQCAQPPPSPTPPSLAGGSLRCVCMREYAGPPSGLLDLLPPGALVEFQTNRADFAAGNDICISFSLGSSPSPSSSPPGPAGPTTYGPTGFDIAAAAEQLRRAAAMLSLDNLHRFFCLELTWAAPQPPLGGAAAAAFVAALRPLARALRGGGILTLHGFRIDRELADALVHATPGLQHVGFSGGGAECAVSGPAWEALRGLASLSDIYACSTDALDELTDFAAAAPALAAVSVWCRGLDKAALGAIAAEVESRRQQRGLKPLKLDLRS